MKYNKSSCGEISFPLGGIGTGSIGLSGSGHLIDWEIFNRPNKGSINPYTGFFIRADGDGKSISKSLAGDIEKDLTGGIKRENHFTGFGFGVDAKTFAGLPHFESHEFTGEFPIAKIDFNSCGFPGDISLTAFNPMIPLKAEESSLPAAFFEIGIKNTESFDVEFTGCFTVGNPFDSGFNEKISDNGVILKDGEGKGDLSVCALCGDTFVQEYWYRGKWQDGYVTFRNEFSASGLLSRHYDSPGTHDVATVASKIKLKPGESGTLKFVLTWSVPEYRLYWTKEFSDVTWKNYYAARFENSAASLAYCAENFDKLYRETLEFKNALHSSTLDDAVIDAVSSTMSVLKSPTVLRLEDGSFWAWEGVMETVGSCEGTCTHVWSYAYALCFLFPELERGIRNYEFKYNVDENGHMTFRTLLPFGRKEGRFAHACVDGQMASVIKTYREWKLSGDDEWLKSVWDDTVKILEYAWNENNADRWDSNKDGVIDGRQHHTLDMELFGASSWLEGMYLAALKAASKMASYLGFKDKAAEYSRLFDNGFEWTKNNLFNGKYFIQKIDLKDISIIDSFEGTEDYRNNETKEIKYQIKDGCEIDQMLAQWHANICGLGEIFDSSQKKTALKNMFVNNFKTSMRNHENLWRVFSLNDESGAVMCDYPEGTEKPSIPIPYCEETMHGFEYSFAGLLISEGFEKEGLEIVKSVRNRYDGKKRNPWNEIECGSNYARSMASFALLPICSGFEFDLPNKTIGFNPVASGDFKSFWAAGTAWGTYIRTDSETVINISGGSVKLGMLHMPYIKSISEVTADGEKISFSLNDGYITFEPREIREKIILR